MVKITGQILLNRISGALISKTVPEKILTFVDTTVFFHVKNDKAFNLAFNVSRKDHL
jgi:hypothetical protein